MVAGSLMVENVRSTAVRRLNERRWALDGQSCFWAVFAFTSGGTVIVTFSQHGGGCSGGEEISGRSYPRAIDLSRSGQRTLPKTAGHMTRM